MGNAESGSNVTCREHVVTYNSSSGRHRGSVIEVICGDKEVCDSWLLLPAENLWSEGLRGFLYILGMLYIFIGMAIASDIFMMSIEVITSRKRTIVLWDEEKQERVERKVLIWNETVSNLTLMALGSSAPEILIAIVETVNNLPMSVEEAYQLQQKEALGVFTIMGSASYNLLIISGICVLAPQLPEIKRVSQFKVFVLTSAWSLWAYVWMLLVVQVISPGKVEIWEAFLTLLFFPMLTLMAYGQDNGWWLYKCKNKTQVSDLSDEDIESSDKNRNNIRVLTDSKTGRMHGPSKELKAIQQNQQQLKEQNISITQLDNIDEELGLGLERIVEMDSGKRKKTSITSSLERKRASITSLTYKPPSVGHQVSVGEISSSRRPSTLRFRKPAKRPMYGGQGRAASRRLLHKNSSISNLPNGDLFGRSDKITLPPLSDSASVSQYRKLTFAAPSYSCLESSGMLEVEVKFHRNKDMSAPSSGASPDTRQSVNSATSHDTTVTEVTDPDTQSLKAVVSVCWETREGSAKAGRDFQYSIGKLTFEAEETSKTIQVPIINDNNFEPDSEFYVILKNPEGDCALGDPSITRVTIIDDDDPGDFLFEKAHYRARNGIAKVTVIRINGSDGDITVEYSTLDGTAIGGDDLKFAHYIALSGKMEFKHGETSKTLAIQCVDTKDSSKNFIIGIRNPSSGAKIGQHSAAVISLKESSEIDDKLAEVLAEEQEQEAVSYAGQFRGAVTITVDGEDEPNSLDYLFHFISMPWKVICAIIPPKSFLGAYPTFVCSIMWIAGMSAIIEQLATLLGCVINFRTAATGVTLVALGTSVPDTFASRTAAKQDEYADAAIGNITGSNSVNVFLGLGLPWVLSSLWYRYYIGIDFQVASGNVAQAVILFCIVGSISLMILFIRRMVLGGELGGNKMVAYATASLLLTMWVFFTTFIILLDYSVIKWPVG